jgi:hypothetical protein
MAALQRVALNFPDLGSEVRYMQHEHVPGVGDRFRGRGRDWIVESVTYENEHAVVTLRASNQR